MIKSGDIVIKKTGGNKMFVIDNRDGLVHCTWCTELCYTKKFSEDELVLVTEYDSIIKQLSRQDRIDELFKDTSE
jgi:uncharacterized protein YodC (DUF2158 family)